MRKFSFELSLRFCGFKIADRLFLFTFVQHLNKKVYEIATFEN